MPIPTWSDVFLSRCRVRDLYHCSGNFSLLLCYTSTDYAQTITLRKASSFPWQTRASVHPAFVPASASIFSYPELSSTFTAPYPRILSCPLFFDGKDENGPFSALSLTDYRSSASPLAFPASHIFLEFSKCLPPYKEQKGPFSSPSFAKLAKETQSKSVSYEEDADRHYSNMT